MAGQSAHVPSLQNPTSLPCNEKRGKSAKEATRAMDEGMLNMLMSQNGVE